MLEDATFEALHALEISEKLGVPGDIDNFRDLLQRIEQAAESKDTSAVSFLE